MSPWYKVGVGVFFFLLGLGYLYRPRVVERINALLRETLFNDSYMALERRNWGIFFLLLAVLFLYVGYVGLYPVQ